MFTDAWVGYTGIDSDYVHNVFDHAEKYAEGRIHVNGIENLVALEALPERYLCRRRAVSSLSLS